jgi:hypothetical protein
VGWGGNLRLGPLGLCLNFVIWYGSQRHVAAYSQDRNPAGKLQLGSCTWQETAHSCEARPDSLPALQVEETLTESKRTFLLPHLSLSQRFPDRWQRRLKETGGPDIL